MQTELSSVSQQLEALAHEWKNFPKLSEAINSARQIVEHPEDYVCQSREFPKDIIPLVEETQDGSHPLSAITYLYDLSPSQHDAPVSRQKAFLQVHFKLCNTITAPRPGDFGPHISIIHASVDDAGEVLPITADQWELKIKKGIGGTRIVLADPKSVTGDTGMVLQSEIGQLMSPTLLSGPYKTTFNSWTGVQVNILPKSPIPA